MFRAITVLVFAVFVNVVNAQDIETQIASFNEIIGKDYQVSNKGKILIIDGFREGEQVKQDKVNIYDLDLGSLSFSESEQAVIIRCSSEFEDCITRILTRERNKKSYRKRILFEVKSDRSGAEIENGFRSLISELRNKY